MINQLSFKFICIWQLNLWHIYLHRLRFNIWFARNINITNIDLQTNQMIQFSFFAFHFGSFSSNLNHDLQYFLFEIVICCLDSIMSSLLEVCKIGTPLILNCIWFLFVFKKSSENWMCLTKKYLIELKVKEHETDYFTQKVGWKWILNFDKSVIVIQSFGVTFHSFTLLWNWRPSLMWRF